MPWDNKKQDITINGSIVTLANGTIQKLSDFGPVTDIVVLPNSYDTDSVTKTLVYWGLIAKVVGLPAFLNFLSNKSGGSLYNLKGSYQ